MSFALNESLSIGSIGYLSCLIIIFLAFVSSMLVDSYIDKSVENEILRNENEILRVESLLDELKMQDKTKTKSSQKEKL